MIAADACSSLALHEPLAGTAPSARAWLVVEHPGPWGRDALTESGLPEDVVEYIRAAEHDSAVRYLAARAIGHDRRRLGPAAPKRVWLAVCAPDGGHVRMTTIDRWSEIFDWDLVKLGNGELPHIGDEVTGPLAFVCTHSRRDTCCAVLGRALVHSIPADLHDRVWECSHLGGHRFAPTCLFLPSGRLYGRLSAEDFDLTGPLREPGPDHLRGPSYLPAPLQAAECAARIDGTVPASATVLVEENQSSSSGILATVSASSGGEWIVSCRPDTVIAPASCSGPSKERPIWRTSIIDRRT